MGWDKGWGVQAIFSNPRSNRIRRRACGRSWDFWRWHVFVIEEVRCLLVRILTLTYIPPLLSPPRGTSTGRPNAHRTFSSRLSQLNPGRLLQLKGKYWNLRSSINEGLKTKQQSLVQSILPYPSNLLPISWTTWTFLTWDEPTVGLQSQCVHITSHVGNPLSLLASTSSSVSVTVGESERIKWRRSVQLSFWAFVMMPKVCDIDMLSAWMVNSLTRAWRRDAKTALQEVCDSFLTTVLIYKFNRWMNSLFDAYHISIWDKTHKCPDNYFQCNILYWQTWSTAKSLGHVPCLSVWREAKVANSWSSDGGIVMAGRLQKVIKKSIQETWIPNELMDGGFLTTHVARDSNVSNGVSKRQTRKDTAHYRNSSLPVFFLERSVTYSAPIMISLARNTFPSSSYLIKENLENIPHSPFVPRSVFNPPPHSHAFNSPVSVLDQSSQIPSEDIHSTIYCTKSEGIH